MVAEAAIATEITTIAATPWFYGELPCHFFTRVKVIRK
jgi:hypothetical protein